MYMSILNRDDAPANSRPTLDKILERVGFLPNVFRVAAHSASALTCLASQQEAVGEMLSPALRDKIALALAQASGSPYCIAAHSHWAFKNGMSREDIVLGLKGAAADAKENAAVCFALKVSKDRGLATDRELEAVREAGYTDSEIVEIIATTTYFLFMNFLTNVLQTDIDLEFQTNEVLRHGP